MSSLRKMRHGYTNHTVGDTRIVVKTYQGPDSRMRLRREHAAILALAERIPVAPVKAVDNESLTLGFVPGEHGQDLIDAGHAAKVLASCGRTLRKLHATDPALLTEKKLAPETVIVHGDFGPNNALFDPATFEVTAVLDWEWARLGDRIEDIAWCEWIIRTHHPDQLEHMEAFFTAYGSRLPWADRQAAMVARCADMLRLCRRWDPNCQAVKAWTQRMKDTAAWQE